MKRFLFLLLIWTLALSAKPLNVVATIPDLGWAAEQIGGEHVKVKSVLTGLEDPHFVDANPRYVVTMAKADVVVFAGLDLEIGWLPKILEQSGNRKVQFGGDGFCMLGASIDVLGQVSGPADRSLGDVHPMGNPHFWLSPIRLAQSAERIAEVFSQIRPEHTADFYQNLANFKADMQAMADKNRAKLEAAIPNQDLPAYMVYHREFIYWGTDHGLTSFGAVEERPGVLPSAGWLARIALKAKAAKVPVVLAAPYNPKRVLRKFSAMSGVPVEVVPTSMQKNKRFNSYAAVQDYLVDTVIKAAQNND